MAAALTLCLTACGVTPDAVPTPAPAPPTLAPVDPTAVLPPEPAPTARQLPTPPAATATPERRSAGSVVQEHVFFSPALGQDMSYLVYLPAGYADGTGQYPAVYMLHGVAGDSTEWPSIGIPDGADRLIAAGEIRPLIIVFPYGDAGFYVNNANGGLRWEDHLVRDVVDSVDRAFRTLARAPSRAVAGLSMGGDGALQLAMRHPDVFGVAAAHSPSSRLLFEHATAEVYGSEAFFRAHNPFWLAQDAAGAARIRIWIDVGDADPWRWNARSIHAALLARGIGHEFWLLAGEHEGDYWVANVEEYLRFYDRALAGP